MEQNTVKVFFALIRSAIFSTPMTASELKLYNESMLGPLIKAAIKHDYAHVLAEGFKLNGIFVGEYASKLNEMKYKSIYRFQQLNYEFDKLCRIFEEARIDFIPLKGSVIRSYYNEEWMRTSCDIDILVHEKDMDRATEVLTENNKLVWEHITPHDVAFRTQSNMRLELHYVLAGGGRIKKAENVLNKVWELAFLKKGYAYWYELPDEMIYFYHISHIAKHFETGGCGVKPFVDLWLLEGLDNADVQKRNALLDEGGILKFGNVMRKLSRVWYGIDEHDRSTLQTERFVIEGGMYGSLENHVKMQRDKVGGGRFKYMLSRIFVDYETLKCRYPILFKHRWLTPFFEVYRWFDLALFSMDRVKKEVGRNNSVTSEDTDYMQKFLKDIGLN